MTNGSALRHAQETLRGVGSRNVSGDDWTCPAHDDQRASLTVKYGSNPGTVVIACGAGCKRPDVLKKLGMQYRDLYDDAAPDQVTRRVHYVYLDEDGGPLFRVIRTNYASGKRSFSQQAADGRWGWRKGSGAMDGVRRVLYRLPELIDAIDEGYTIHLAEGEKDADALNSYFAAHEADAFATCHPMGAGKWRPAYTSLLAGADAVVVWADRDGPGYRCALGRLSAILAAGIPATAVLPIPDHKGADAYDHLEAGHSPDDAKEATRDDLAELAGDSSDVDSGDEFSDELEREMSRLRVRREAARRVDAEEAESRAIALPRLTLAEALAEPRPKANPQRIARLHEVGYNSTISAKFKTGKTTLGGNLLRCLADGEPFLEEFTVLQPDGRIGLLNYELTDSDMLDWLTDQGINHPERIAVLNLRGESFSLANERNQEELVGWCRGLGVEVLHLDPHRRAFMGFGSENSNDDVNRFTDALDVVKKEAGVVDLFLYVHMGRMGSEPGAEHARGATALDDWADQRWVLTKDENEDRFMYVDGRMDYVPEFRLDYDKHTRHLTAEQGNRRDNERTKHRPGVLNALETAGSAGALVGELEQKLQVSKKGALKSTVNDLISEGLVIQRRQGNAKRTWLSRHAPEESES